MRTSARAAAAGLSRAFLAFRWDVQQHVRWCEALVVRGYWIGLWSCLHAWVRRVPLRMLDFHGFIYLEQRFQSRKARSLLSRFIESILLRLVTHVVAVSRGVADQLPRRYSRPVVLLENGADAAGESDAGMPPEKKAELHRRLGLTPGRPVFTVVAHFVDWLDSVSVVRAAADLREEAEFLLIGEGSGLGAARAEATRLDAPNLHFTGLMAHEDVRQVLKHVTLACICPYSPDSEKARQPGFFATRKVKEYLAAGRPVLVADVPGREGCLVPGRNCLLYRPACPDDLVARVRELTRDPALTARLGEAALQSAANFTWARLCSTSGFLALFGTRTATGEWCDVEP